MGGTAARYVSGQGPGYKQLQAHLAAKVQTGTYLTAKYLVAFWSCLPVDTLFELQHVWPVGPCVRNPIRTVPRGSLPAGMVHPPPREIVDWRRAGGLSIHITSSAEMTRGPNLSRSDTPLLSAPPWTCVVHKFATLLILTSQK